MGTVSQTLTPSFTPPPAAACSLTVDTANAKMKVAPYLLSPASGAPAVASVDLLKRLGTTGSFVELVGPSALPLVLVVPTTQTGFSAYRQCPTLGLARNLVPNGGFIAGSHGWTLHANATVVVDATSVSGYAVRTVATASGQYTKTSPANGFPVEAGKAYSFAAQHRGDGTTNQTIAFIWRDAGGIYISEVDLNSSAAGWTELTSANNIAPGNARTLDVWVGGASVAGIVFTDAVRVMQQTTAPAAWIAAHQQYISRGLAIYEAGTNLAADGDMEAVGVASWTANNATLTKDTTNPFAGAKRLKVVNTLANGGALQNVALAAGQPVSASVRCIGGDAGAGLKLESMPSGTVLGTDLGASSDWTVRRASGVIAGGDTSWRVQLIGGSGGTTTSYFDNLAVENKAYDTMNADPSGQAFALASRVASDVRVPTPAGFDPTDFAVVGVFRIDVNPSGLGCAFGLGNGTDYIDAFFNSSLTDFRFQKGRAGVASGPTLNLGLSIGDTIAWAGRFSASTGLRIWASVNGAAVVTASVATAEALLLTAAPTRMTIGQRSALIQQIDGTISVTRILKGGLADATISALVANPYQDPTDNDLAVWGFEGQTYQIPAFDDHLVKLGYAYDWRADTAATGANAATAQGQTTTGTVAALADSVWLKVPSDPTKNYKFPVKYEEGIHKNYPRRMTLLDPLSGSAKIATLGPNAYGAEAIKLRAIVDGATGHDVLEAKLLALLNLTGDLWLQDLFGGLRKVRFPNLDVHDFPLWQWNELTLVEVQ